MKKRTSAQIVAIGLLFFVLFGALVQSGSGEAAGDLNPRSASERGLRIVMRTLQRLGAPVETWARDPGELAGTGNILILTQTKEMSFPRLLGSGRKNKTEKDTTKNDADVNEQKPAGEITNKSPGRLLPREDRAHFGRFAARGNTVVLSLDFEDDAHEFIQEAFGFAPLRIQVRGTNITNPRVNSNNPFPVSIEPPLENYKTIWGEPQAPFAVEVGHGAGSLIVLASFEPFTNDAIRRSNSNLDEWIQLLYSKIKPGSATDGRILLDTYYFGERDYPPAVPLAFTPAAIFVTIHVIAAFFVWTLAFVFRFGAAREPKKMVISNQRESALGIATLYQRASKPGLAANELARGFVERAKFYLALPHAAPAQLLSERIVERTRLDRARVDSLIRPNVTTDQELLTFAKECRALEAELEKLYKTSRANL